MTAALALSGVLGALAIAGALAAFAWWLARWARNSTSSEVEGLRELRKGDARIAGLERAVQDRDRALKTVQDNAARARRTLKTVERQRDEAVENLVALGDSDGIAAGIRGELERLRTLSEELSGVPPAAAAAAPDDSDGDPDV